MPGVDLDRNLEFGYVPKFGTLSLTLDDTQYIVAFAVDSYSVDRLERCIFIFNYITFQWISDR